MPLTRPAILLGLFFLSSCASTEELKHRLERRNEAYMERQERRKMRHEARDDRYHAWYDRIMH